MKRIYVEEKWCLGCHLCEYNCAFANSGKSDMAAALKNTQITPNICVEEKDDICFAVSCRHCEEPLCVKGCLTGALKKTDGVIVVDKEKCISCYTCILSCPYGAITPSPNGIIQKCELCISDSEEKPACVAGCPNGAIIFEERG